jgi:anti-sigma factor RsiW
MREGNGVHQDAAAYGLGVLDDPGEFEAHLSGCARCRVRVAEFRSVTGALAQAVRLGYLPPGDGTAPRRKSCLFGGRLPGSATGTLLLVALAIGVTALCATGPAFGKDRSATVASIVSPAQVVAGTGAHLRDLPRPAGFQ